MPQQKKQKPVMKFRLMTGLSSARDLSAEPDESGRYPSKVFRSKDMEGYKAGDDIVESTADLEKLHGRQKFQKLGEETLDRSETLEDNMGRDVPEGKEGEKTEVTRPTIQDLERSSAEQLRKGAEANNIDLKGATTKAEMIKVIRAHYGI